MKNAFCDGRNLPMICNFSIVFHKSLSSSLSLIECMMCWYCFKAHAANEVMYEFPVENISGNQAVQVSQKLSMQFAQVLSSNYNILYKFIHLIK